jgi:hypothetical protein
MLPVMVIVNMNKKSVLVLSFWPGNDSPNAVGGFDWWDESVPNVMEALKNEMLNIIDQAGDTSFSVVRMMVPDDLDSDGVTDYISRNDQYRELPEQDIGEGD